MSQRGHHGAGEFVVRCREGFLDIKNMICSAMGEFAQTLVSIMDICTYMYGYINGHPVTQPQMCCSLDLKDKGKIKIIIMSIVR